MNKERGQEEEGDKRSHILFSFSIRFAIEFDQQFYDRTFTNQLYLCDHKEKENLRTCSLRIMRTKLEKIQKKSEREEIEKKKGKIQKKRGNERKTKRVKETF